jgi:thiamine biosynthesis protein ThiS
MSILVNGETTDARGATTIAELIDRLELPAQAILIEHNGLALHRHEWSQRTISADDRVELIRVVAGG